MIKEATENELGLECLVADVKRWHNITIKYVTYDIYDCWYGHTTIPVFSEGGWYSPIMYEIGVEEGSNLIPEESLWRLI